MKKFGYLLLVVAVLGLGIVGCSDFPTAIGVTEGVAQNPGVLFGKVVDAQTLKGIAGATVYIKVAGQWRSVVTKSATTGGAENEIGNWSMSNLPTESQMNMVVKGPQGSSYISYRDDYVYINNQSDQAGTASPNNETSYQYDVEMDKGVTATVYVVDSSTGSYVAKSDGSALTLLVDLVNSWYGGPSYWADSSDSVAWDFAAQDATDKNKYTYTVSQQYGGCVYFPAQDVNGDGIFDYYSSDLCVADAHDATLVSNLAVDPATGNAGYPEAVATNVRQAGNNSNGNVLNIIGKSDAIKVFFNEPLQLATSGNSVRMYYTDELKTLTAPAVIAEVSATVAMSSDGIFMTVTPAAALTENQTYTIDWSSVSVRAKAYSWFGNDDTVYSLSNNIMGSSGGDLYVYATGAGTMGSSPVITVDNFNYCNNGAKIVAADTVANCATGGNLADAYLIFPENVWGTVSLVSYQSNTTTVTYVNNAPTPLYDQGTISYLTSLPSGSTTYNNNWSGSKATGAAYVYWLGYTGAPSMLDSRGTTTTLNSFKLEINAYDAEGNVFHTVADYPVQ